ncbi:MAG: SDR family oxidoreductase [Pseudomonadota bacterium]
MRDFKSKVAAITGAGSGMGRALALELARRGCHVAISDITLEPLEETASQIAQEVGDRVRVTQQVLDVSDRDAVYAFAKATNAQHGKVNLIFNNAGVSVTDTVERLRQEDFEWLMNINFWGVVYGSQAFLPYLKEADEAHIINTASIFGVIAVPTQSAYNASKFAVRGFTEALHHELVATHIGVSCVQPGGVKTNIVKTSRYYPEDNQAPTKEEAAQAFESFAALSPPEAANIILRGVERRRCRILVGRDAQFLATVQRLFPERYHRLLSWLRNREERRRATANSAS